MCAPHEYRSCQLCPDWDWHQLVDPLKPDGLLERELERLVLGEGFMLHAGAWEDQPAYFSRAGYPGVRKVRQALEAPSKSLSRQSRNVLIPAIRLALGLTDLFGGFAAAALGGCNSRTG